MKKNIFRKSIICGIFILLLGLCFTPTLSGNIEKISNQSQKESPIFAYLDFTIGYWKFDECNGNTAYDSSGHDFDGTINGASWTTHGTGCALDFDGNDDYVSLDAYSEHLGFNKTDDVIFSGSFKSESTKNGIIYSMSDSWDKENPEFTIQLCGNGSLMVQIWVNYCGILIYSKDTGLNNGKWHDFKIYYHGTTANPKVELYVDKDFDNDITEWLCSMFADEFRRAKIGRRAVAAERDFDGEIDNLKIIKYPGGNERPSPPEIEGDEYGDPGEQMCFTFTSTDYEGDELKYYIDFGNGDIENWIGPFDAGDPITECTVYNEIGTYEITARSTDYWHYSLWSSKRVSIGNHAPFQPKKPTGSDTGSINIEYCYTTSTTDAESDPIFYNWSWGDGTYSGWIGPFGDNVPCTACHTWTEPGTYDVKVKAKDEVSGESAWSDILEVNIVISALKIDKITGGLFFVKSTIRNSGSWEATDVSWDMKLTGGQIILGGESKGTISSIPIGEQRDIHSRLILGLGPTTITVTAQAEDGSHDIYDRDGFVLFFYIKIRPGGG